MMTKILSLLALVVLMGSVGRSEFVFTVGNGTGLANPIQVTAGDTVLIPIYGHFTLSAEAAGLDLIGAQAAFDFQNFGVGGGVDLSAFPSVGSINAVLPPAVLGGGITFSSATPNNTATANWDKRFVANFSGNVDMTTAPQRLFDLQFTVPTLAPGGIYGINIVPVPTAPSNGTIASFNQAGTNTPGGFYGHDGLNAQPGYVGLVSVSNGSIQITAVPEPSSMALMGIFGLGVVAARRFRKHRSV